MTTLDPPSLQPTRHSLLSRLRDWNNQDSWQEFFNTYWKLIYAVARKSGLDDQEAQDAVQDTILCVAKKMADFKYDRSKGRFKAWLKTITRRRVADILRRRYREQPPDKVIALDAATVANLEDPAMAQLDATWDAEWQQHIVAAALDRVRRTCPPLQFQIFELTTIQGHPPADVARVLKVSRVSVHVTNFRVRKMLRASIQLFEEQG
jgi:RNA polymerase sigma factor (sigma-70 family)